MVATLRRAAVAGSWYPGSADAIRAEVDGYLKAAGDAAVPGRLVALLSPHAGLRYSGPVAAHGYALLRGRSPLTVLLVGPSHREAFDGVAVHGHGAWETPLGRVEIDERLAETRATYHAMPRVPFPTAVLVDNEGSERYSIVEVRAADRLGLLYAITSAMHELALDIAERIRKLVEDTLFEAGRDTPFRLSISIGVGTFPQHGRDRISLLEVADKAMYRAKSLGRNCVCSAADL